MNEKKIKEWLVGSSVVVFVRVNVGMFWGFIELTKTILLFNSTEDGAKENRGVSYNLTLKL